ncbi:MAG: ISLre2 family transposase [Bacillota bacterium]|jgi:hypothetical protein
MEFNLDELDLGKLEATAFRMAMLIVREALGEILGAMDDYLATVRDKKRYEIRELEERELDTLVGVVRFKRRSYRDLFTGEMVHLLDQTLKIREYQRISEGVARVAVSLAASGPSYRNARDKLEEMLGERVVSHEGIRQLLFKTSEVIDKSKEPEVPRRRVKVLFIEADGLWTGRQGKRRKEQTRHAVVHEGWRERYPGSREYETIREIRYMHPQGCRQGFWERLLSQIEQVYDLEDTIVIINGDGASWIREGVAYFPNCMYQYDRFHISRDVRGALSDRALKAKAVEALRDNDLGQTVEVLEAGLKTATGKECKRLRTVKDNLMSNWEYILDYRLRLEALGYDCSGLRGLGSGESNIGKFKSRVRGRAWSQKGIYALGNVLFKVMEGSLGLYTRQVVNCLDEQLKTVVTAGAGLVKKAVLGEEPGVKRGHFPCLDRGTEGYAVLFRRLLEEGCAF